MNSEKKLRILKKNFRCITDLLSDEGDWVYIFIAIMFSMMILDLVSKIPT